MSLTNALQAARTGLFAAQAGIDLVSRNIANASTEGYTRKVQPQSNLVLGNQGAGVSLDAIVRLVDKGLQRTFFDQISTTERLDVIGTSLEKLESLFGKPSDQDSIAGLIGRFREAVSTLSTSPDSQTAQTQAVQAARDLATELNHLSTEIQSLRPASSSASASSRRRRRRSPPRRRPSRARPTSAPGARTTPRPGCRRAAARWPALAATS